MSVATEHSADHDETWEALPWYVNARLSEHERQRADAHLRTCAACREELGQQRQIHDAMAADAGVEQLPTAGLKRLQQRLAAHDAAVAAGIEARPQRRSSGHRIRLQGLMAASVAVMAVALSVVAGVFWTQSQRATPADYYTVTVATPRAANYVIRAVFSPTITLSELQTVLDDARLKIVAGPTEAGVYSLASATAQPAEWSLGRLRHQPSVRFAEPVVPLSATAPRR